MSQSGHNQGSHVESQLDHFNSENLQNLAIDQETERRRPKYPEFAFESARKRSFDKWPSSIKQSPEEMCDAGFFYTQRNDTVRCFSCGGGLRDWLDGDIPWEQHALWHSECDYLNLLKGQEYIDSIKNNQRMINLEEREITVTSIESKINKSDNKKVEGEFCDTLICKLCYLNECNVVFIPCGHIIACKKCASSLINCPVCRKPFLNVIRIYFS